MLDAISHKKYPSIELFEIILEELLVKHTLMSCLSSLKGCLSSLKGCLALEGVLGLEGVFAREGVLGLGVVLCLT